MFLRRSARVPALLAALGMLLFSACTPPVPASAPGSPVERTPLTFMAGYKPQANLPFVGVYAAQALGYFHEEGLEVTIQHSPGKGEHLQLVAGGKVQVTTQDAAVMLMRRADPGLPLVSIGLIGQRGQQAYAALAKSGMQSPKDWEGHTVGFKGTPPPDLLALLRAAGADPEQVALVNVGFDPRVLTEGKVDVYPVFRSNEPYLMRQWGYTVTVWDASQFGVPTLGLAYVTSEETLAQQPEALEKFRRAALRGIAFARDNPERAVDFVLEWTGPETDRAHMRFMLDSELEDLEGAATREHGPGWQTLEQWQALHDMLVEFGAMQPTDVEKVFWNFQ
jgi:ABC-type nitrate/sulfonate/bicarbonate transport system substrate-binding protein